MSPTAAATEASTRVRQANAATKAHIAALPKDRGMEAVARLLRHGDVEGPLGSMPVRALLMSVRCLGDKHAGRFLLGLSAFEVSRVRRLGVRKRLRLATDLEHGARVVRYERQRKERPR